MLGCKKSFLQTLNYFKTTVNIYFVQLNGKIIACFFLFKDMSCFPE